MAITRTAKGTTSAKTSGTTLTLSGITADAGSTLVVGVAWEVGIGNPDVTWGNKDFRYIVDSGATQGDTRVRLFKKRIHKTRTKDVTITWPSAVNARVMFCSMIKEASAKDVQQTNTQTATGAPATGTAVTSTVADTISIAAFASLGPGSDTAGTAGVGHTLGQRVGTVGVPPVSNITIQETYEILTATGNVRATLSGATARDWANTIVAFSAAETFTVGDSYYQPHDATPESEVVVFVMEDSTGNSKFWITLDRETFEDMTDAEVDDHIRDGCVWWANKQVENDPSPDFTPDATFNTRVASFVNDTIAI